MKAIIQTRYGDEHSLKLTEVNNPTSLLDDDIMIQVKVANLSSGDQHINTLDVNPFLKLMLQIVFGFGKPRQSIRGISGSGMVVAVGAKVNQFKIGDRVNFIDSFGASTMATFKVMKAKAIVATFDSSIEYSRAAPIGFGAMTADFFINENTVKPNNSVLIYGASGSVGTYAVSLARHYGGLVTAVASSRHINKLSSLHANRWLDYHHDEFKHIQETFDVVFDAVGKLPHKIRKKLVKPKGKFYSVKSLTKESSVRLQFLNDLLQQNKIVTIIDQQYPMVEFKQAHRHLYEGHKTGNVLLTIDAN